MFTEQLASTPTPVVENAPVPVAPVESPFKNDKEPLKAILKKNEAEIKTGIEEILGSGYTVKEVSKGNDDEGAAFMLNWGDDSANGVLVNIDYSGSISVWEKEAGMAKRIKDIKTLDDLKGIKNSDAHKNAQYIEPVSSELESVSKDATEEFSKIVEKKLSEELDDGVTVTNNGGTFIVKNKGKSVDITQKQIDAHGFWNSFRRDSLLRSLQRIDALKKEDDSFDYE